MSIKTYKQATWEAMKEEMLRDPSVYAMAEDIIGNGGSMGHYIGLGEAVGDQSRVLDAPISETAIVARLPSARPWRECVLSLICASLTAFPYAWMS